MNKQYLCDYCNYECIRGYITPKNQQTVKLGVDSIEYLGEFYLRHKRLLRSVTVWEETNEIRMVNSLVVELAGLDIWLKQSEKTISPLINLSSSVGEGMSIIKDFLKMK